LLFNSPLFLLVFLPAALIGFFLIAARSRLGAALFLGLSSLVFYAVWNPRFVLLLLSSVVFNYVTGYAIGKARSGRQAKVLLSLAVTANLGLLGFFKYTDFFIGTVDALTGVSIPLAHIVLPLGISFFTFTQIAFLVDVSRGIATEYNFIHYLLFVTYFPHLIAGPVLHHKQMMPQFQSPATYRFNIGLFTEGFSIFLIGLAKKVVLADSLAAFVSPLFDAVERGSSVTFFEAWGAALAYTFQLYFDFSGYSDMAIGLSLLFGVRLPLNFASPYKSLNIIDFWRRWLMTLSQFLRDYLYLPLGGNRLGPIRRYVNLMITMMLGGLWHGASWTFVVWGTLHGLYLVGNHGWRSLWAGTKIRSTLPLPPPIAAFSIALTFLAVVIGWVIFRAKSLHGAVMILTGMAGQNGFVLPSAVAAMIPGLSRRMNIAGQMPLLGGGTVMGVFEQACLILLASVLCFGLPNSQDMNKGLRLAAITVTIGFVIQAIFFGHAPSPFLYFQF
jgi:alginate O-acetyltransferase complex protein AlgI